MKRCFLMLLAAAFLGSGLYAQTANPLSAELKGSYTTIKNNLIKSAEKMPEEHYGFKPSPEMQSFRERLAHIADSTARTCGAVKGEQKNIGAASKTTKAEMVAALNEAFTYCDSVIDSMTDAELTKMVTSSRGQRSRLATLSGMVTHNTSIYGALTVYMRLKGVIPPSSER